MGNSNYQRLINLAEEVFSFRSDPSQLDVDQEVRDRLSRMHPSTMLQESDASGPVAWLLVIPTTTELMERFLEGRITEKELYVLTPEEGPFEALYLCSALVLEEYRRKGIVNKLGLEAIMDIRKDHPLSALFAWPFTEAGTRTAEKLARIVSLPLFLKEHSNNNWP